jgi:hypothetical protein
MGTWTLERLAGRFSALNTGHQFGHDFYADYRLVYKPSTFDTWVETPRLDWHERIIKLEHNTGQWYEVEVNYYLVKPQSNTYLVWSRRYIEAYNAAAGLPPPVVVGGFKGSSRLLDKSGSPVPVAKLGVNKTTGDEKANAVRSFLKKNGGILAIEVHDIPNISLPLSPNEHVDRYLMFNVGVEGGNLKLKAEQHLHVDANALPATWTQTFSLDWRAQWATRGLNKVAPPANLVNPVAPLFSGGEYW